MFNIRNVADLKEQIEQTIHKDQIAISLPYCKDIQDLPERLECLQLKVLLLFTKKDSSLLIPDLFFEGMKELKVIDFTGICFSSLSSTLAYLVNLQTLCLDYCQPKDTAIVGQLKEIRDSQFSIFPHYGVACSNWTIDALTVARFEQVFKTYDDSTKCHIKVISVRRTIYGSQLYWVGEG